MGKGIDQWVDNPIEEALIRAKRYLRLEHTTRFDAIVYDTLKRRLTYANNAYIWIDGMRSALFW